jgi:chromosome partitioning protein
MCKVISISNQKGGTAKTASCVNIGTGLAREGYKVLLIDADPQGSLSISLGFDEPDKLENTLSSIMLKIINDEPFDMTEGILHHDEGVDLLPGNIELSGLEVSLTGVISRETILKEYVSRARSLYDYIIIDCMPSLGMLTVNALACADSVLIPVQAAYLPVKGLQQLLRTIGKVQKQLNPDLAIEGILITMVDKRTNYAKDIAQQIHEVYSGRINVFRSEIPLSVRASEVSAEGSSLYVYDPRGKAASAYRDLIREVIGKEAV